MSVLTSKGDIYGFSTVPARVPVGSNGQGLYADSSQGTGLKWQFTPIADGSLATGPNGLNVRLDNARGLQLGAAGVYIYIDGSVLRFDPTLGYLSFQQPFFDDSDEISLDIKNRQMWDALGVMSIDYNQKKLLQNWTAASGGKIGGAIHAMPHSDTLARPLVYTVFPDAATTIKASVWQYLRVLKIRAWGRVTTTGTNAFALALGLYPSGSFNDNLLDISQTGPSVDSGGNNTPAYWYLDACITISNYGTTSVLARTGSVQLQSTGATNAAISIVLTSLNAGTFDLTVDQTLNLAAYFPSGSAVGDTVSCDGFLVESAG